MYQQYYQQPFVNYQQTRPYDALIRVTGIEGARAYAMPQNSTAVLFDGNSDIMYVKTTDGAGFPTIRAFAFTAILLKQQTDTYVTRKLFELLKEMINNGKLLV